MAASSSSIRIRASYSVNPSSTVIDGSEVISNSPATWSILSDAVSRSSKQSRFVGNVMPDVSRVIQVIAKSQGETIQVHGAEAARRFKLSTQMPTTPVFYTSGPTREIRIGDLKVKLMHTSSQRKLQHAGKKPGLALSALWYLGKENVNSEVVRRIKEGLSEEEFETLRSSRMPAWMSQVFEQYEAGRAHG